MCNCHSLFNQFNPDEKDYDQTEQMELYDMFILVKKSYSRATASFFYAMHSIEKPFLPDSSQLIQSYREFLFVCQIPFPIELQYESLRFMQAENRLKEFQEKCKKMQDEMKEYDKPKEEYWELDETRDKADEFYTPILNEYIDYLEGDVRVAKFLWRPALTRF
ncbi:hypothetical protein HELRODRAFT_178584 [Helobdella robusta]|uniref:Uncharacterized protein n=1 Tax=Helobdella robusta TaxID=6412 RepID=T1FDF0_HELRO|nr:hypothetical protein HELRODRAFT_178584 [Helobdella robusta]ESN97130.1 hypothetical protein HELRODRAFT_178584 [Helobdella robusta]